MNFSLKGCVPFSAAQNRPAGLVAQLSVMGEDGFAGLGWLREGVTSKFCLEVLMEGLGLGVQKK